MLTPATPTRRRGRPPSSTRQLADQHLEWLCRELRAEQQLAVLRPLTAGAADALDNEQAAVALMAEAQRDSQPFFEAGEIVVEWRSAA
jgi:hypothetical protein